MLFCRLELNCLLVCLRVICFIYQGFGLQSARGAHSAYSSDLTSCAGMFLCIVSMSNTIYPQRSL